QEAEPQAAQRRDRHQRAERELPPRRHGAARAHQPQAPGPHADGLAAATPGDGEVEEARRQQRGQLQPGTDRAGRDRLPAVQRHAQRGGGEPDRHQREQVVEQRQQAPVQGGGPGFVHGRALYTPAKLAPMADDGATRRRLAARAAGPAPEGERALIARYLERAWAEQGLSPLTQASYRRDLEAAARWLAGQGSSLLAADRGRLYALLAARSQQGYSARSSARIDRKSVV